MKRTQLKRTSTLKRTPLAPGVKRLRRTNLKRQGKRREREKEALAQFREGSEYAACEECGWWPASGLVELPQFGVHAHHLCSRAQGVGHPLVHSHLNRAWLCTLCHDQVHRGLLPQYIRSRRWLDTLTEKEA